MLTELRAIQAEYRRTHDPHTKADLVAKTTEYLSQLTSWQQIHALVFIIWHAFPEVDKRAIADQLRMDVFELQYHIMDATLVVEGIS